MTRHVDTTSLRCLATVRGPSTLLTKMADTNRGGFLGWVRVLDQGEWGGLRPVRLVG